MMIPLTVLSIISLPITLDYLTFRTAMLSMAFATSVALGLYLLHRMISRDRNLGSNIRSKWGTIIGVIGILLFALWMAFFLLYRANVFTIGGHIPPLPEDLFVEFDPWVFPFGVSFLAIAFAASVLGLTYPPAEKLPFSRAFNPRPRPGSAPISKSSQRFWQGLTRATFLAELAFICLIAVGGVASSGLAEVIGGEPWLPAELLCVKGVQPTNKSRPNPEATPLPTTTTAESCRALAGISQTTSNSPNLTPSIRGIVGYVLSL